MMIDLYNLISFPFLIIFILTSILGFGLSINKLLKFNVLENEIKNLFFFQGLIFIGFIFIIFNIFIPISDFLSFIIILLGSLLYIFHFLKINKKKQELIFIFSVSTISFIYSIYSGLNDDFNYHYETIKNYQNKIIFEIEHHRNISYNSHWLFLKSIFSISIFSSSLFILTSLLFSIAAYDFYKLWINSLKNEEYFTIVVSFFVLIFLLGVLPKYKDLGTDAPGVIINIYILIIILRHFFDRKSEEFENVFLVIFLLCQFVLIIKITNSLIFLLLIFLLFKIKIKKINFLLFSLICLMPLPWIFQNYIISNCLIWPISFLCFSNIELALNETYLIESFAKGDITTTMEITGFSWIKVWLSNHSVKIIETYGIYIFILLFPLIYLIFMKKFKIREFFKFINIKYLNLNYLIILITVLISNCIWFFFTPAYRFGIFYNLSLIILIILPLWLYVIENNFKFLLNYSKFILVIICTYFIFENLRKIDWYLERYDTWPPIYQGNLIDRKNF